jgi:serine/threonine-protein kinase RsbW
LQRDLVISSDLSNISEVRFFLDQIFSESGFDRSNFNRVFLGLSEAVNNSIVHGNKLNTSKRVFIRIQFQENQLKLEIKDEGEGFDFDCIEDPTCFENLKKENGRGIFLISQMADDLKYSDGGRSIMIKYYFEQ